LDKLRYGEPVVGTTRPCWSTWTERAPAGSGVRVVLPPGQRTSSDWGGFGVARTTRVESCDQ
jgi:hypothetical protein